MAINSSINFYLRLLLINFILLLGFISIFRTFFSSIFRTDIFKYADEVIFALCLVVLSGLYVFSKKLKLIHLLILSFIVYSIVISLLFGYNNKFVSIVLQTLINIKFFIFLLTFIILFKKKLHLVQSFFKYVVIFSCVGLILHLIFGTYFNNFIGVSTFSRPNIRYVGFLPHPNHLAYLAVLYIGLIFNFCKNSKGHISKKDWFKISLAILVIILTDSRTSIIAVFIFFIGYYWLFILNNYRIFLGAILSALFIVISIFFFTDVFDTIVLNIEESFDLNSHYIRGNMIYLSVLILYQFFPIGGGAATFGSVLANDEIYALYGQAERYYFINDIGIYDSNIASIVGEYGVIGILFFIAIFMALKIHLKTLSFYKKPMINSLFFVFLFFSITNPMFTNNIYILLSVPVFILFVKTYNSLDQN